LTEFTCLLGGPAFSQFQRQKLVDDMRRRLEQELSFNAQFIYLVESPQTLSKGNLQGLEALLQAGLVTLIDPSEMLLVVPRLGTQSPWSTKATDIAHRCGLEAVSRIERGTLFNLYADTINPQMVAAIEPLIHDRMTQTVLRDLEDAKALFDHHEARPLGITDLTVNAHQALEKSNRELGLALSPSEIEYLIAAYEKLGRNPTDAELMMFAQANSEHCRHKIFNASWTLVFRCLP